MSPLCPLSESHKYDISNAIKLYVCVCCCITAIYICCCVTAEQNIQIYCHINCASVKVC